VSQGSRPGFTKVGLGTAIDARASTFPFIAIFPQAKRWSWPSSAMGELKLVEQRYNVDAKRVYLTGLSMGGIGGWNLAPAHPGTFAALALVSARPDNPNSASQFVNVPIWAFEGDMDQFFSGAIAMKNKVNALGGHEKFTEYYGVGHDAWENAYGEFTSGDRHGSVGGDELYAWLLEQRLR
jgi:predicted peptidase